MNDLKFEPQIHYKPESNSFLFENFLNELNTSEFRVKLYPQGQKLIIFESKVIWLSGEVLVRQINVEGIILDTLFTTFDLQKSESLSECEEREPVLVIVLEDQMRVYDRARSTVVVSFPMYIRSVFPYYRGVVLGKKPESSLSISSFSASMSSKYINSYSADHKSLVSFNENTSTLPSTSQYPTYNDGIFLTLSDPIGDYGCIVSSSTTSFSPDEELILFPNSTNLTLAVTYNVVEERLIIYYTRYIYRSKNAKAKSSNYNYPFSRRTSKRSISSSSATVASATFKYMEDEQRTTRATSNPMSYDRMASGSEHHTELSNASRLCSSHTQETWSFRKDVIFSKIYTIPFISLDHPKVFTLAYKEKEALIVVNRIHENIRIYLFEKSSNQVSLSKYKTDITLEGIDASILDMGQNDSFYIVVLKKDDTIMLYNPFYELSSPVILLGKSKTRKIEDTNNYEILLKAEDGTFFSIHLHKKPLDPLVSKMMESLKFLSHDLIYENFWLHWYSLFILDLPFWDDWKLYVVTLLALCIPEKEDLSVVDTTLNEVTALIPFVQRARKFNQNTPSLNADLSLESLLPKIVLSLHLIREDLRLNTLAKNEYQRLSILLSQLVHWLSWSEAWLSYYDVNLSTIDHSLDLKSTEYISQPPNIMDSLSSLFGSELISYITFSIVAGEDESVDKLMTPRTYDVLRLFEVVVSSEFEDLDLIKLMAASNIDAADLETFPPGIFFILKNTIEHCQQKLKLNWNVSSEELKLINRNDLLMLDSTRHIHPSSSIFKKTLTRSAKQIVTELSNHELPTTWHGHGQTEAEKFYVTKLLFSDDRRFYEVTKLLQTSKTQKVTYDRDNNMSDYDKLLYQRSLCCRIAMKTLTTPIGRGAVFISSRKPLASEGFPIPKMNFNILVIPDNVNVSLESNTIPEYLMDWGYFHNGASSGLSVTKDTSEINGSWIAFNKPPALNSQHAGFLLGLGLNGHLKNLEEWHIYNYLGPKHAHTSVGLLLGMSASLKGTMNVKMTKILTVHVVAFLPPGSTNLNVSLPVQTAGIIGIGLVYLATQHRRMSEILLTQINSSVVINEKSIQIEGYNLAAGIALGYVNLAKGPQLILSNDRHIIDMLVSLSTSIRDVQTLKELDKSCSGAIIAITLIFLRTNNSEIADKLRLPQTLQLLEYIRPDLLALRSLACNLILWDKIKPSKEFVESQIPLCVLIMFSIETIDYLESKILAYTNILSGVLLSIALCFASTGNGDAKSTLLYYFDHLLTIGSIEPTSYDSRATVIGVRNARDVAIIGLSLVMAGTGDLDVMRRLRYLQGLHDENTRYGNYMAINMALGFLFLGGGQQAFRIDDDFAIAALLTSLYPMFGSQNYEFHEDTEMNSNKGINDCHDLHLQALRHFWALSVEDRCLVVRDIEGHTPVKIDVDVYLKNETIMRTPAPCLLPNLNLINKIKISSNNIYFPVEFDLVRSNKSAKDLFRKSLTLYVDRKVSYKKLKLDFQDRLLIEERMGGLNLENAVGGVKSLKDLNLFGSLDGFEKDILFESVGHDKKKMITRSTIFDFKKEIENIVTSSTITKEEKVVNLKLIFNFVDTLISEEPLNSSEGKRKRRKKDETNQQILLKSDESSDFGEDDSSRGLYYLNVEFIEKMKKDLFSKLF